MPCPSYEVPDCSPDTPCCAGIWPSNPLYLAARTTHHVRMYVGYLPRESTCTESMCVSLCVLCEYLYAFLSMVTATASSTGRSRCRPDCFELDWIHAPPSKSPAAFSPHPSLSPLLGLISSPPPPPSPFIASLLFMPPFASSADNLGSYPSVNVRHLYCLFRRPWRKRQQRSSYHHPRTRAKT